MEMIGDNHGPWCFHCGYCLHGLASSSLNCPECGHVLSGNRLHVPLPEYRSALFRGTVRWFVMGSLLAILAVALVGPFAQHPTTDHHLWDPRSQEDRSTVEPKYLGFFFVVPRSRLVLGLSGIPIKDSLGAVDLWMRRADGSYVTLSIDPYAMDYTYAEAAGTVRKGASFDEDAVLRWAADAGVLLTTQAERDEVRELVEFIRAKIAGRACAQGPSQFRNRHTHWGRGSGATIPTIWTLLTGLAFLTAFWSAGVRRYRRKLRAVLTRPEE